MARLVKKIACDHDIRQVVEAALKTGQWVIQPSKGHGKLRHENGRVVVFGKTTGDHRAVDNLRRDIRHAAHGLPGWGQPNVIQGVDFKGKTRDNSRTC